MNKGPLEITCKEFIHHDSQRTWLNDWQVRHRRLSPIQAKSMESNSKKLLNQVKALEKDLSTTLAVYFPPLTCEEWLETFIIPIKRQLSEITIKASQNWSTICIKHREKSATYMFTKMCQMCFMSVLHESQKWNQMNWNVTPIRKDRVKYTVFNCLKCTLFTVMCHNSILHIRVNSHKLLQNKHNYTMYIYTATSSL